MVTRISTVSVMVLYKVVLAVPKMENWKLKIQLKAQKQNDKIITSSEVLVATRRNRSTTSEVAH